MGVDMFLPVMRRTFGVLAFTIAAGALPTLAADTAADNEVVTATLDAGLVYVRADDLGRETVRAAVERALASPAAIVDLRFSRAEPADAAWLRVKLEQPREPQRHTVYVLANADTASSLGLTLSELPAAARVLVLAPEGAPIPAQLRVSVSPEQDRAAFAAGGNPALVPSLVTEVLEKRRFDEATLVRRHANGRTNPPAPANAPSHGTGDALATPAPNRENGNTNGELAPPPPRDVLLQRAVFMHRGLVALRRAASA